MSQGRATPAPHLMGLLRKDLPNGTAQQYTSEGREAALVAESHSIFLPNVTCSDSGQYTCHLAAPVGEQNREGHVLLTLTGDRQKLFSSSGCLNLTSPWHPLSSQEQGSAVSHDDHAPFLSSVTDWNQCDDNMNTSSNCEVQPHFDWKEQSKRSCWGQLASWRERLVRDTASTASNFTLNVFISRLYWGSLQKTDDGCLHGHYRHSGADGCTRHIPNQPRE